MTTSFTATTPTDFDDDITDISSGVDSATNTAYTITLSTTITVDSEALTLQTGSSLAISGDALTVAPGDAITVTGGVLTLDTAVSGDAYVNGGETIALNGGALVNGSGSNSGANQVLTGSVRGQSTTDSVDNFGQIAVASQSSTSIADYMDGGAVTNESTGTIQGGLGGVVFDAVGTVTNAGTIAGDTGGFGTYFALGGTVYNGENSSGNPTSAAAAIQSGFTAVEIDGAAGSVFNAASIQATGTTGSGVKMYSGVLYNGFNGASVVSIPAASIQGGEFGVQVVTGSGTVTNLATIAATDTIGQVSSNLAIAGVLLSAGGTVYNGLTSGAGTNGSAAISGTGYGVLVQGAAGTVYNSGTISGNVAISFALTSGTSVGGTVRDNGAITSTDGSGSAVAIQFGDGASTLALGSGYAITGKVEGGSGNGDTTTLELTGGSTGQFSGVATNSGTLTNGSNAFQFDNVDTIAIDANAVGTFSGVNAVTTLLVGGTADVAANGSLEVTGSSTNAGTISLGANATLVIDQTATGAGTIGFGANAALVIDQAAGFGTGQGSNSYTGDVIAQFATGNSIDLKDVAFATLTSSFSNNQLQLGDGTHTADLDFTTGQFTALSNFSFASDGVGGGTVVTVACYCPGTLIATPDGEVAVEDLAIGDRVLTADGRAEPIRWIGHRSYAGRFVMANPKVQPIRFRAGSLGEGLPRRELLVSPEHAMLLDGVLVPARCLVNGVSILPERGRDVVDYIHIELADHDVILAEGAASETFIDDDSRSMFHNASDYDVLYPNALPAAGFCAPRLEDGYELEAIRQRLARAAGWFAEAA